MDSTSNSLSQPERTEKRNYIYTGGGSKKSKTSSFGVMFFVLAGISYFFVSINAEASSYISRDALNRAARFAYTPMISVWFLSAIFWAILGSPAKILDRLDG